MGHHKPAAGKAPAAHAVSGGRGRNQRILDQLTARGADSAIRVDRPHDELAATIAADGRRDLIVHYLWGAPAEAVFTALIRAGRQADGTQRTRYILVGMAAGEVATLPAMALRVASVQLAESAAAYDRLLQHVAAGEISLDVEAVPLANVEETWQQAGSDRRIVFVP